jgi:hypothetical protein
LGVHVAASAHGRLWLFSDLGDVLFESAKRANADIDQIAVANCDL